MATPAAVRAAPAAGTPTNPLAQLGQGLWRLFTSVDFAVVQIIFLSLLAVIGMTIQQLPDFAQRSPADYVAAMDEIHLRYDPVLGTDVVGVLERLGVFTVFKSAPFGIGLVVLVISIVVCTLDRTPRLWRDSSVVRVAQPEPFFDPRLPDRAAMTGVAAEDVARVVRSRGFHVRQATEDDGTRHVYGDRHQYTKMATLFTHLGLILFLVAAAVTSRFGDEQGLVVPEGESLTVQPIGTPGLLLVKNLGFDAPGFETGMPTDFTTDLAVFQDGQEIARKTIRVNDPLAVGGYTFHQNGFGPAPHLVVRDAAGKPLWDAQVPMTDSAGGAPYVTMAVPGRDLGLQLLLGRDAEGLGTLLILPYTIVGEQPGRHADPAQLRAGHAAPRRHPGLGRARHLAGADRLRRVHAAHRQARPRAGHRLDGVRLAHHRDRHHVLPAAPSGVGPDRAGRQGRAGLAVGPLRRCRARVRAPARRPRRGPPTGLSEVRNRAARVRQNARHLDQHGH